MRHRRVVSVKILGKGNLGSLRGRGNLPILGILDMCEILHPNASSFASRHYYESENTGKVLSTNLKSLSGHVNPPHVHIKANAT